MDPLLWFANAVMFVILGLRNLRGYMRRKDAGPDLPSLSLSTSAAPVTPFNAGRLQLPDKPIDRHNSSFGWGIACLALGFLMAGRAIYILLRR
jgi:hypothetical protein